MTIKSATRRLRYLLGAFACVIVCLAITPSTINIATASTTQATRIVSVTPTTLVTAPTQPTPILVNAIFQQFEHGFMLWRSDRNCVYVYNETIQPNSNDGNILIPHEISAKSFGNYTYCLAVIDLPVSRFSRTPSTGLQVPTGTLGKVWSYYQEIRTTLGYATAPQRAYRAAIPFHPCTDQFSCTYMPPQLTLPDHRVLACGMRAASAGTCTVI